MSEAKGCICPSDGSTCWTCGGDNSRCLKSLVYLNVAERNAILYALQMCVGLIPAHGPEPPNDGVVLDLLMKIGMPVTCDEVSPGLASLIGGRPPRTCKACGREWGAGNHDEIFGMCEGST